MRYVTPPTGADPIDAYASRAPCHLLCVLRQPSFQLDFPGEGAVSFFISLIPIRKKMLPNHYMDVALDDYGESIGYFSRAPDGRAVVFVHGFMGGKLTTWNRMHEELLLQPSVAACDILFFGYPSVLPQARASAGLLRQFIEDLVLPSPSLAARLPSQRRGPAKVEYSKILIVAHSLGAAITRRALLDAHATGADWPRKSSLLLFAPAHCGAKLAALRKELASSANFVAWLSLALAPMAQAALDLEPTSQFITELHQQTMAELSRNSAEHLKAKKVIFGHKDNVVTVQRFCQDPLEVIWRGHGHVSVCKVSASFRDPMQEVLSYL